MVKGKREGKYQGRAGLEAKNRMSLFRISEIQWLHLVDHWYQPYSPTLQGQALPNLVSEIRVQTGCKY